MKTTFITKRTIVVVFLASVTISIFGDSVMEDKDVLIRRDKTGTTLPVIEEGYSSSMYAPSSIQSTSPDMYETSVTAFTNENTLSLTFDILVRKLKVAVYDQNDVLVYQRQISTYTQSTLLIDMSMWDSGDYTIKINYGTTNLIGEFTLE